MDILSRVYLARHRLQESIPWNQGSTYVLARSGGLRGRCRWYGKSALLPLEPSQKHNQTSRKGWCSEIPGTMKMGSESLKSRLLDQGIEHGCPDIESRVLCGTRSGRGIILHFIRDIARQVRQERKMRIIKIFV
jgi:hypothetical protein